MVYDEVSDRIETFSGCLRIMLCAMGMRIDNIEILSNSAK